MFVDEKEISCNVKSAMCPVDAIYHELVKGFFCKIIESKDKIENVGFVKLHLNMKHGLTKKRRRWGFNNRKIIPFKWNQVMGMEYARLIIEILNTTSIKCLDLYLTKFGKRAIDQLKFWYQEPFGDIYVKLGQKDQHNVHDPKLSMDHVIVTKHQQNKF